MVTYFGAVLYKQREQKCYKSLHATETTGPRGAITIIFSSLFLSHNNVRVTEQG